MAGAAIERERMPTYLGGDRPGTWTNSYCSTCLRTRRFFDRPGHLVCETCSKRLEKVAPPRRSAG